MNAAEKEMQKRLEASRKAAVTIIQTIMPLGPVDGLGCLMGATVTGLLSVDEKLRERALVGMLEVLKQQNAIPPRITIVPYDPNPPQEAKS